MIKKEIKDQIEEAKKSDILVIEREIITSEIWNEIFKLINLQRILLNNNQLKKIPKQIAKLTNFKELILINNQIKEIPKEIIKLTNLQMLWLIGNQIKKIPKEITNLTNLQELSLVSNQIKEIPKEIAKLTNLKELSLISNQIKIIPEEIAKLTNLKELSFVSNQIKEIPKEIAKLTNLHTLSFSNNQIKELPKEFIIKNFKLFEDFRLTDLSNNINIIIGKNGTGKTTLLQAITFALIGENNKDIANIKLGRYIRKNTNNERISHFKQNTIGENTKKAVVKAVFNCNLTNELHISNKLESVKIFETGNLLLSYGVNLFYKEELINRELLNNLISGLAKCYSIDTIFKDYSTDFIDPTLILHELTKQNKEEIKQVHDILLKVLNNFLSIQETEQFQIVWHEVSYYYQNTITKENFILSELSEGYRSNILLVSDIFIRILSARNNFFDSIDKLFNNKTNEFNVFGNILIDEFDRHLHPSWQRLFLPKLRKILPNIQFFLTTHNPVSLQSAVGGIAHEIIIDNGKIEVESSKIEANNILDFIDKYFYVDFFDMETQKLLNQFSDYMDKIHDGDIDLIYSEDFRNLVQKISDLGDNLKYEITSNILQLNSTLKKLNKKEFKL